MWLNRTIIIGILIALGEATAAQSEFTMQDFHPSSPMAYQFQKYDEMPVSEYTGMANVSIPLYTISVDGISIPLQVTYHGGGIRVSEDASWVGLGWDLTVGSIVQEVHNIDDYSATTRVQPDYQNYLSFPPTLLPFKCNWSNNLQACQQPGPGYSNPYPIYSGPYSYAYAVATDYYMPIGGNFNEPTLGQDIAQEGSETAYDSDPDIFTASFLGHSLKFVLNFSNNQIVVLNKPGYSVTRNGSAYEIIDPDGEQFYFAQYSADSLSYVTSELNANGFNSASMPINSSKVWMLTKIITKHQRQILFNYTQTASSDIYPSFSERWDSAIITYTSPYLSVCGTTENMSGQLQGYASGITQSFNYSKENRLFLQSITFPSGAVNFSTSSRSDVIGGLRLDSVKITNQQQVLFKAWYFNYTYLNSGSVGGNTYTPNLSSIVSEFGSMPNLRLSLQSVNDNSGAVYNFTYNPVLLPPKNSLAQDLWGFYNGQLNNKSLTPNPARYANSPSGVNNPLANNTLISNGNNVSSSTYYSKASTLIKVQYPTGGVDSFEYEPNQFSNYWTPDSANSNNTVTTGDGLRIHAIDYYASPSVLSKRSVFSYNGGLGIVPLVIYRNFTPTQLYLNTGSTAFQQVNYNIYELSAKGFFSTNALGSVNGVGYSEVTRQDVDLNGNTNGSEMTYFANAVDKVNNSGVSTTLVAAELPATKNTTGPANGSVDSIFYFDKSSNLIKKVNCTYGNIVSPSLYGVKVFGYGGYMVGVNTANCNVDGESVYWQAIPQTLLAFYPIYDFESLMNGRTTTDYGGGDSLVTYEAFDYDQYDQLSGHSKSTPAYYIIDHTEYPGTSLVDYTDASSVSLLQSAHRYTDVLMSQRSQGPFTYQNEPVYSYYKHYKSVSGVPVESYATINKNLLAQPLTDTVSYDSYSTNFFNLQQYASQKTRNCILWDYQGIYPIAEIKNATISNVAYTSFEADGSGNWTIPSSFRDTRSGITGATSYQLSNGSISVANLNASTTYIVSYWSLGASYSVSGSTAVITGKTVTLNGYNWTYYEHTVTGVTSISVSGSGNIDELRLYPSTAQMTTYTYSPLVGMTSQCDLNNRVTYYQYDVTSRLTVVQDQDGNVVKRYCYNYSGQAQTCPLNFAPPMVAVNGSNTTTETFAITFASLANNTTYNFSLPPGNSLIGEVPQGSYVVTMSPNTYSPGSPNMYLINSLPQEYYAAVDYNPVNVSGNCSISISPAPAVPIQVNNTTTVPFTITFTDVKSGQTYSFTGSANENIDVGNIPADTYNISIVPQVLGNVQSTSNSGVTFSNVSVSGSPFQIFLAY
jgi:hypothetical protein